VSGEGSLIALQTAAFPPESPVGEHRERSKLSRIPSYKGKTVIMGLPSKGPMSKTITLGIRALTYGFGGMQTFIP